MVYFGYYFDYRKGKAHIGISNDTKMREFKEYTISDIVRQIYQFSENYDALKQGVTDLCEVLTCGKDKRKSALAKLESLSMNDNVCLQYIIKRLFEDYGSAESDFVSGKQSFTKFITGLTLPLNIEKKRKKWETELMNTFGKLTSAFVSIEGTLKNPDSTATAVLCGDYDYTICNDTLEFFVFDLHRSCRKNDIQIRRCEICGKMFASSDGKVKYCSSECGSSARKENIRKARTIVESDPLKREVERSISNMKNNDKKVKDALGADDLRYIEFHGIFAEYREEIRDKRDRLTHDIERDKINVGDALAKLKECTQEHEKKLAKKATVLLIAAKA